MMITMGSRKPLSYFASAPFNFSSVFNKHKHHQVVCNRIIGFLVDITKKNWSFLKCISRYLFVLKYLISKKSDTVQKKKWVNPSSSFAARKQSSNLKLTECFKII